MEKLRAASPAQLFITVLRIACFCIFAGRAWQYLMWDAPFRALLWDQALMQGVIESITSMTWEEYTSSIIADKYIQLSITMTGWLFAACALLSLFVKSSMKWAKYVLVFGIASIAFLAYLDYKEKFFQVGELMEHAIQLGAPLLLSLAVFSKIDTKKLMLAAKAAVAVTFTGHAMYAWGYYPQPGPFIDMLINILHFNEGFTNDFLKVAAILDVIVAVLIFVPRTSRAALMYCVVWGGLTASARVVSGFDSNFIADTLNQYLFETVFRLSNALIPLWIFFAEGGKLAAVKQNREEELKPYTIK
jgi:hypothetical protein